MPFLQPRVYPMIIVQVAFAAAQVEKKNRPPTVHKFSSHYFTRLIDHVIEKSININLSAIKAVITITDCSV
jgi:hypothetical protein